MARENGQPFIHLLCTVLGLDAAGAAALKNRVVILVGGIDNLPCRAIRAAGQVAGACGDGVTVDNPVIIGTVLDIVDIHIDAGVVAACVVHGSHVDAYPVGPGQVNFMLTGVVYVVLHIGYYLPALFRQGAASCLVDFDGVAGKVAVGKAVLDGRVVVVAVAVPYQDGLALVLGRYLAQVVCQPARCGTAPAGAVVGIVGSLCLAIRGIGRYIPAYERGSWHSRGGRYNVAHGDA